MRGVALAVVIALAAAPALGDMVNDCVNEAKRYDRAIEACTEAINSGEWSGGDLAWAYTNRGLAHYELGEYRDALADYSEALELDPDYGDAHYGRAAAYCSMGRPAQAARWYAVAIEGGAWPAGEAQRYLQDEGFYYGVLHGRLSEETLNALAMWARASCR